MNPPPFLLAAALLFWGWQTSLLPLAALFALLVESSRLIPLRWNFSKTDFSHITDVCTIILLSIMVISFTRDKTQLAYDVGRLLPVTHLPLLLAQAFSEQQKVQLSALSLYARLKKERVHPLPAFNLAYPFILLCLIAAGIANLTNGSYWLGTTLIGLIALWPLRPHRYARLRWLLLILLVAGCGHLISTTLYKTQEWLTELSISMLKGETDPLKSITSIGDIGRQKLHNTILFRAKPEHLHAVPPLLREATYNAYRSPSWYAVKADSVPLPSYTGKTAWNLSSIPPPAPHESLMIEMKIRRGKGLLKLPPDTYCIEKLPAGSVEKNPLGAITVADTKPTLLTYRALHAPGASPEAPPHEVDWNIPDEERPAIEHIISELNLRRMPPEQAIATLKHYFNTEFHYSLEHKGKGHQETPLANFLLERKAGHCELFATATVLILRACDIPARYAVGYAVAEFSPFEKQYIIRQRHGHAWTRLFLHGHWQDLDTTSPNWLAFEDEQNQSPFQVFSDVGNWLGLQFSRLRWSEADLMQKWAIGLMLALILMIANRVRKGRKKKKTSKRKTKTKALSVDRNGLDSPFYSIEHRLEQAGYPRTPGESLSQWALRLEKAAPEWIDFAHLRRIIQLHYQYRFQPEAPDLLKHQLAQQSEALQIPPLKRPKTAGHPTKDPAPRNSVAAFAPAPPD